MYPPPPAKVVRYKSLGLLDKKSSQTIKDYICDLILLKSCPVEVFIFLFFFFWWGGGTTTGGEIILYTYACECFTVLALQSLKTGSPPP